MKLPVTPNRDLGQHFLVDENILGVIGRLAELGQDDVVLEIGPGLGVLTGYLAERVRRVHAVELDRALEPHLAERLAGRDNVELHFGDALRLDLAAFEPAPGKLVANLPYNVATPLVVESLDGLPSVELWTVMVQREVADRFFAEPSTKAYGAVSVLIQLAAKRTGFHPVSRTVFRPSRTSTRLSSPFGAPGCRSRIPMSSGSSRLPSRIAGRRCPTRWSSPGSRHGHERPRPWPRSTAPRIHARKLLLPRVRRAHRGASVKSAAAPAKINLALVVGPVRADGKHEVATVLQRIDLADRISFQAADEIEVHGFPEDTLVREALRVLGVTARVHIEKRIPVGAGLGGGSSDAAAALRLANELRPEPLVALQLHELAAGLGADVPFFLAEGPQLGVGDGTELSPVELASDYVVVVVLPSGARKASTATVYAAFSGAEGFAERRAALEQALEAGDIAALPPNDLASSPLADELQGLGAFRAGVSGAGPAVYGLFAEEERAEAARVALANHGESWLTKPAWYR